MGHQEKLIETGVAEYAQRRGIFYRTFDVRLIFAAQEGMEQVYQELNREVRLRLSKQWEQKNSKSETQSFDDYYSQHYNEVALELLFLTLEYLHKEYVPLSFAEKAGQSLLARFDYIFDHTDLAVLDQFVIDKKEVHNRFEQCLKQKIENSKQKKKSIFAGLMSFWLGSE